MTRVHPSLLVALALSGLGVRLVREDDVDSLTRHGDDLIRAREQRPWRPSSRAVEYIHTDKPVSKRRARRQRGRAKA